MVTECKRMGESLKVTPISHNIHTNACKTDVLLGFLLF